jgi:serine/threonine protein kinase
VTLGHRNLYEHHYILHRDVSVFNIMIDDSPRPECGFLIDLDLAIRRDRLAASGASHRTGTLDFMATGLLHGQPHTFRHDLESFFFVLIWIATFYTPAPNSVLRDPRPDNTLFDACHDLGSGDMRLIGKMKLAFVNGRTVFEEDCLGLMEPDMRSFLQPVLRKWRELLFPSGFELEPIDQASAQGADPMYDAMIEALEEQISVLTDSTPSPPWALAVCTR